jgi:hypothetical protein
LADRLREKLKRPVEAVYWTVSGGWWWLFVTIKGARGVTACAAAPTYGSRLTQKGALGLRPVHTPSAYAYEFEHAENCSGVRTIGAG